MNIVLIFKYFYNNYIYIMNSSQSPSTGSPSGSPSTGSPSGSPSMSPEHMQKTAGQMAQGLAPSFENIVSVLTLITPLTFALYFIIESIFYSIRFNSSFF